MTPDTEHPYIGSPAPPVDPADVAAAKLAEHLLLGGPKPAAPAEEPPAISLAKQKLHALRETLKSLEATEPSTVVVTLPELLNLLEVLRTQRGNHYVASLKERLELGITLPYAELQTISAIATAHHAPFPALAVPPPVAKLHAEIAELDATIAHAQGQLTDAEVMAAAKAVVAATYVPPIPMTKPPIGPAFDVDIPNDPRHGQGADATGGPSAPGSLPTHAEHKFNPFTGKEK